MPYNQFYAAGILSANIVTFLVRFILQMTDILIKTMQCHCGNNRISFYMQGVTNSKNTRRKLPLPEFN